MYSLQIWMYKNLLKFFSNFRLFVYFRLSVYMFGCYTPDVYVVISFYTHFEFI